MLGILILCVLAGLLAAGLTPMVRRLAVFAGALDLPSARKVHARETPRTGGLAIAIAWLLTMGVAAVWKTFDPALSFAPGEHARLMLGAVPMLLVGLADDLYGLRARWKLALEIAIALLMVALGMRIDLVSLPFVGSVKTGVFGIPLTVFWLVAVVNAINLIDGLDGLASGIALIAAAANGVIALRLGRPEIALLLFVMGGALLGFLRHNLHPATIFLGDSGSLFLGFFLAMLSLQSCQKGPTAIAIVLPMLTMALPLADTVAAFLRRTLRPGAGAWWMRLARAFHPDRQHVHHRLLRLGFGHAETVTLLHLVCLLFAAISVAVASVPEIGARFILLYAAVVTAAVARKLGLFGRRATAEDGGGAPELAGKRALLLGEAPGPLQLTLHEGGVRTERAADPDEGLRRYRDERHDLVVAGAGQAADPTALRRLFGVNPDCVLLWAAPGTPPAGLPVYEWLDAGADPARCGMAVRRGLERSALLGRVRYAFRLLWLTLTVLPILLTLSWALGR